MRPILLAAPLALIFLSSHPRATAQDSTSLKARITGFPSKVLKKIAGQTDRLNQQLDKQTASYLQSLSKQEQRLKRKLSHSDSARNAALFADSTGQRYALWLKQIKSDTSTRPRQALGAYYPSMDSLKTTLAFLNKNPQLLDASKVDPAQLQDAMGKLQVLQNKMQDADQIKQYIAQRQAEISASLTRYSNLPSGALGAFNGYNQRYVYYKQQVQEFKDAINNPDKMKTYAISLVTRLPAYATFFRSHSMLANVFHLPGTYDTSAKTSKGLPTRDVVMKSVNSQYGKNGPDLGSIVQGKVQSAQNSAGQPAPSLSTLGLGGGGADLTVPDFHPNPQKTKSFLKRLIFGFDLQTLPGTSFLPATSDLGLSLAYKFDNNNSLGIGGSYKIGWGQNISHLSLSSQGVSIRSFGDFRIKKTWYATGGFEYNYQQPFQPADFPKLSAWTPSGLIGISKIIPLKTKIVKSTKVQLLWDFLSYQQLPKTAAFLFRVGYSF